MPQTQVTGKSILHVLDNSLPIGILSSSVMYRAVHEGYHSDDCDALGVVYTACISAALRWLHVGLAVAR